MSNVLFVTAIYSKLYGTEYGGRPSRGGHYKFSLLNLVKRLDATFVCYTSSEEAEDLKKFFHVDYGIKPYILRIVDYELKDYNLSKAVSQLKDYKKIVTEDRCYDLQYLKTKWLSEQEWGYDYYYWIDAGLSYSDLFPRKYLAENTIGLNEYFNFQIFNKNFLENLFKETENKIFVIGKNNKISPQYKTLPPEYYKNYRHDIHIIGGMFGGHLKMVKWFNAEFQKLLEKLTEKESRLYFEEYLYTNIILENRENFNIKVFDNWQHDHLNTPWLEENFHLKQKSFYKVFEELQ